MINKDIELTQFQRIIVSLIYLAILSVIFNIIGGGFKQLIWDSSLDSSILFYAGALMIVLGSYIVEPYFTKPSDAIANSLAIIIALLSLNNKSNFFGYKIILLFSFSILILSIISIYLKDYDNKASKISYFIVKNLGSSKFIFSLVYLSAAYSYFATSNEVIAFITIVTFWIIITFFDLVGLIINKINFLFDIVNKDEINKLGEAIGCDNPLLYKIENDFSRHKISEINYGDIVAIKKNKSEASLGMIINVKQLLNKQWLTIYLFQDSNNEILRINIDDKNMVKNKRIVNTNEKTAFKIQFSKLGKMVQKEIEKNPLFKNKDNFIGFVTKGSNINKLKFSILRNFNAMERKLTEGTILKTKIYGTETLYQVIDGNTQEEHLENYDTYGFIIGIARKIGQYKKENKELNVSKWLPSIYSPVYLGFDEDISKQKIENIAKNSIGRLPETDMEIPLKDVNSLVTHNTAILGILGIGKSCLAYEIIKKVTEENIKVICIDITNEYYSDDGLKSYLSEELIEYEISDEKRQELKSLKNNSGDQNDPKSWGNVDEYKKTLFHKLTSFIEGEKKILILNPDWHPVSKAQGKFKIKNTIDLTVAEKTRIISEMVFKYAMEDGQSAKAKYFLVYEEAHSLIPEWNSVANEGDKKATNGTAKVILQGRKYGLGSLTITQRTANVSKSILNQCNTIFALRVFDDTGKIFLENYIGEDYANTLPTLPERHAVAIGKGLKLKQPVILQLNNKDYITN